MRRRSSADPSSEHHDADDSTADHSPITLAEHDDKLDSRTEGLQVKVEDWVDNKRWKSAIPPHTPLPPRMAHEKADVPMAALGKDIIPHSVVPGHSSKWRQRLRNPWTCSPYTVITTLAAFLAMFLMAHSFLTRQQDVKGCGMSYMRPTYSRFTHFDTEHTRFATKYSLYLYREGGLDEDSRACGSLS